MKKLTFGIILFILIFEGYSKGYILYGSSIDPIEEVFAVDATVKEKGTRIQITDLEDKYVEKIIRSFGNISLEGKRKEGKNTTVENFKIKGSNSSGYYILSGKELTIYIKGDKKLNLRLIRDNITRKLDVNYSSLIVNDYIIYSLDDKNINIEKEKINKQIKLEAYDDFNEINLSGINQYTFNTHKFLAINNGDKKIDMSVAFIDRENVRELIIATPIIPITY